MRIDSLIGTVLYSRCVLVPMKMPMREPNEQTRRKYRSRYRLGAEPRIRVMLGLFLDCLDALSRVLLVVKVYSYFNMLESSCHLGVPGLLSPIPVEA
jgi:hypothetical protein